MEETWQAKCSSEWQPANQMDMNSRRNFHPFTMQGTNLKDHPTAQEPLVFHTFNLDLAQSGKTELSNSFVALLSGHSHLSANISQLPNLRPALPKLPIHSGGANFGVPATSIQSLSENHGDDSTHNKQTSSFVESRQSLLPNSTKALDFRNSHQIATSHFHGVRASKPASDQSFQASNRGMVVLPNWTVGASPEDTSQQHTLNIQTAQKNRIEAGPFASGHNSADFRGRPRVFCMNTAGLLFLSDGGLLGVICFCHSLQMSVAKFCEHSGSSSVNPGEAVRLENGMTIAQWCRLCFGNNPPDDGKGWDWSDIPRAKGRLAGSQDNNFPSLSKIPGTIDFGGSGRSGECWNKSTHNNLKIWTNKGTGNMHQRNGLEGYNHFLNDFPTASQSPMPALVNSHIVQAGKKSPSCMGSEASRSFFDNREKNVWPCLIANRDNFKGRFGNPSIPLTYSNIRENLSHEYNVSRGKEYAMVGDGNSSNVDLRLGQPSQHTHAYATSFPTAMNPLQFGEVRISRKAPINLLPTETTGHVTLTKKPRQSPVETSSSVREQAVGSSNAFSQTECEQLTGNSTKSPPISLFLSHLSTAGNSLSQSTPVVNNNRYLMARPLDLQSVSSYLPENISETNNRHERKYSIDGFGLSNNIDKVKGPEIVDTKSCNIVKGSYMVHSKQRTDATVVRTADGAHRLHSKFSVGDSQPSWHISHQSSILQNGPDALNCNKYGEVPFLGSKDNHNHTVCGSTNVASHATARPDLSSSGTPMNLSSPKAMDTSQPTFSLPNKRSIDCSQHLMDENMRLVALRHSVELSNTKQEQSGATCRTSPGHQRLCCHSTMQLQRVLCKDMLGSPEEFRHGSCSDVQQDASQFAIRPPYSYLNCYSAGGAEMLASKPGARGNECCSCTAVTPRISQCPTCHVCGAAEHQCLRLQRIPNISSEGFKQMHDQKEKTSSIPRNCCCTVPSKNLTGCCFLGGDKPSMSTNEQSVPGKARIVHINPACDKDHMFQCGENIRLGRCEFSRENILIMNDCKTGHWRDVPTKSIGQSDGNLADKPARMLEDSSVARNRCPGTALKESDGPHQMSESRKEQQMSNNCSGSSAVAITEISAEVNNTDFHAINIDDAKNAYNPLVDEASGIEKCGSSDEALGSGECEVLTVSSKVFSNQSDCSPCHSSGNLNIELRLESPSNKRRVRRSEGFTGCGAQENIKKMMPIERVWKVDKLNVSVPKPGIYPINEMSPHCKSDSSWNFCPPKKSEAPQSDNVNQNMCDFPIRSSTVKRKRSALSASRPLPLSIENHGNLSESDKIQIEGDDQSVKVSAEKEAKAVHLEKDMTEQKGSLLTAGKPPKYMSLSCIRDCKGSETGTTNTKARPVVCGKSGIISNGRLHGRQKPAKIVSLSMILKKSKRCDMNDSGVKSKPLLTSKNKETHDADVRCCDQLTSWKLQHNNELCSKGKINGSTLTTVLMSDKNSDRCLDDYPMAESETGDESHRVEKSSLDHKKPNSKTKSRHKEARRSSLSKLLGISEYATACLYSPNLGEHHISNPGGAEKQPMALPSTTAGIQCQPESSIQKCSLSNSISLEKYSQNNEDHADAHCRTTTQRSSEVHKCQPFLLNSDAFCCVCGFLNKEANNFLLECKRCFIRVHQACYGISKVPKGDWFCRPCKTDSQNTACVLCGYGGGAMTRAVKSQSIARSLLKAWDVGTRSSLLELVPPLKSDRNKYMHPISFGDASKFGNTESISAVTSTSCEAFPKAAFDTSPNQTSVIGYSESLPKKFELCNSITAGVLDSSVTQWVHVVCGLWTPGTRCPNVDTMGAFDVSGASAARKNIVCSMCNRPGGSCIRCRVLNCSVHFHPWCAHQKGLLQSETEGDDNENVGFYGRCTLHSTQNGFHVGPVDAEIESPRKDWTCARTEGFKGRKSEQGFKQYLRMPYKDNGGCIVSPEQINAWLHINGQKSCTRPVVKSPCSDVEHDFRKEYFRYKQLKAWKHLVVYKSGIHALGLYTSQLIARGAMVVEYVGEIVGLRIADKRELEYQSGKRLQYKSACYFFRIDKEHIIDATRKGGIARFVNHSCLPNCVAKIISVRNEKKVVFFAERDINPGEEITYDYHFNREDEGQKIPCFCNSKNCRQYLN